MVKLTKNMLLNGKKETKTVELKTMDNTELELRYLTQAEINKYNELSVAKLGNYNIIENSRKKESEARSKINIKDMQVGNQEAEAYLMAKSLSIDGQEPWIENEVLELNSDVYKEIWEYVVEINNITTLEDAEKTVKDFHQGE